MLFANDMVLINETREGVNSQLKPWTNVLESKGNKIIQTKIEYKEHIFIKNRSKNNGVIKINDHEIPQIIFIILIQTSIRRERLKKMLPKIRVGWMKWMLVIEI